MSDKLNINSKKWHKKYSEDRGYGSDESLTMADTGDYSTSGGYRAGGQALQGNMGRRTSTRSGDRTSRKPTPPSPGKDPVKPSLPSKKPTLPAKKPTLPAKKPPVVAQVVPVKKKTT